jgi:phosphatidylserine decarboxylase
VAVRNCHITRIAFKMYSVAAILFVMGDFPSFFVTAEIPKFKLSGLFCMNERAVLLVQNRCTENV